MARKGWILAPSPSRRSSAEISNAAKAEMQRRGEELIASSLKPRHLKPPPEDQEFNYLVDIFLKWHGNSLLFCSKYNCPSPNAISPSFEDKFARIEYAGPNQYNLSYRRHTEQWCEIGAGLTLDQCLEAIKEDPLFTP
jgi:hypothetical protein